MFLPRRDAKRGTGEKKKYGVAPLAAAAIALYGGDGAPSCLYPGEPSIRFIYHNV